MEEGKKEGMEAWQGARAGSVPQMCPHHPGGNVLSGQERPPHTHIHTFTGSISSHFATEWTGPPKQLHSL